ncbi:MAG: OmpH family outer membrane protein [Deltaproteobacteria bacterium]|nr:OmpH family outer membrane protein [Deltaproteobacteria bacterium]
MFTKAVALFVLGSLSIMGGNAWAENAPAPKLKFGMVDFQKAINESTDGKKAEQSMNAAVAEKKKKFDILKNELDVAKQDFEKQRLVLSGQPLQDKQLALQKKLMQVEQTGATYEQELSNKKAESLKKILTGLQTVVQGIGQKEGYTLIFEKSQGGVLFSAGAEDITDRVIKEYNAAPAK